MKYIKGFLRMILFLLAILFCLVTFLLDIIIILITFSKVKSNMASWTADYSIELLTKNKNSDGKLSSEK